MKHILLFLSFTLFYIGVHAQSKDRERVKAFKIAYITEKLNLTSNEAEKFWPLYNEYQEITDQLRKNERKTINSGIKNIETLSDSESDKILDRFMELNQKRHDTRLKFALDLRKILPSKKVITLFKTEKEFNKRLMERLRGKRGRAPRN